MQEWSLAQRLVRGRWVMVFWWVYAALQAASLTWMSRHGVATFWPPAGLAVGVIMLAPRRLWGWFFASLAVANGVVLALWGRSGSLVVLLSLVSAIEMVATGWLLRRNGDRPPTRVSDVIVFLGVAGFLVPAVGGLLAASALQLAGSHRGFWNTAALWGAADGLGVIVAGPAIWFSVRRGSNTADRSPIERVGSVLGLTLVSILVFFGPVPASVATLVGLPLLGFITLWPSLRLGIVTTAVSLVGVAVPASLAALHNVGPVAAFGWTLAQRTIATQVIVAAIVTVQLVVGQLIAQRDAAQLRQRVAMSGLQSHAAALVRANADLADLGYVVAHDFNEPLRSIASHAELLGRRLATDDSAHQSVAHLVEGVHTLRRMTDELLASARLDVARYPTTLVDLNELVRLVQVTLAVPITEARATIDVANLPSVHTAFGAMFQIMQNLVANALRHAQHAESLVIRIEAEPVDQGWMIVVADNGAGWSTSAGSRPSDSKVLAEPSGTGLGLSICQRSVERLGGFLWSESVPTGGVRVCFTIAEVEPSVSVAAAPADLTERADSEPGASSPRAVTVVTHGPDV